MKHETVLNEFERFLLRYIPNPESRTVQHGVAAMLAFYRDERAEGCVIERDGDMLLYQWGVYDWGKGEFFELDITRQLVPNGSCEDEDIWQLSLTFKFDPTPELRDIGRGNRWCPTPNDLTEFESFIRASKAYQTLAPAAAKTMDIDYQCAE